MLARTVSSNKPILGIDVLYTIEMALSIAEFKPPEWKNLIKRVIIEIQSRCAIQLN